MTANTKPQNDRKPNADQQKAIDTIKGPVLIIAGPGSGKTYTLVERVKHLLVDENVAPESIFISTFTEKAARELVTRISNSIYETGLKINVNNLCIGTLHSIFLNLLEEFRDYTRLKKNYSVWDQFDQQYMIYKHIHRFRHKDEERELIGKGAWWQQAGKVADLVNKVSEAAIDATELQERDTTSAKKMAEIYAAYEKLLDEQNALDFSKIQFEMLKLLENPEVADTLRARYKYFMIDEYQDTNSIQANIISKMLNSDENICVVGDDDQGLYRFRGATIRNILEFEQKFKNCTRIDLTINYRSHSGIINFYNDWMAQQDWSGGESGKSYRFDKVVRPNPKSLPNEPKYRSVMRVSAEWNEDDQDKLWCQEVVEFLRHMQQHGNLTDLNQVVFLFKSVAGNHAEALAQYLEDHGIRVYSPRSKLFFERPEIKFAVGGLCKLYDYQKYFTLTDYNKEYGEYLENCTKEFESAMDKDKDLNKFVQTYIPLHAAEKLDSLDYALSGLFYQLLQFDLFADNLGAGATNNLFDGRPARNLAKFTQMLTKFEYLEHIPVFTSQNIENGLKKFFGEYLKYLYDGGIEEYEDDEEYAPSGSVSFMTIHQSKGLEFPIVFVCSLWENPKNQDNVLNKIMPDKITFFEPEDEIKNFDFMRVYYTAYSRAQNLLCLSCPEKSTGRGRHMPSKSFDLSYSQLPSWRDIPASEYANIKLERIKTSNIKKEYAFTSHIAMYEGCPLQYKFFRDLGFAPVRQGNFIFGTLVHQTIEDIHKSVIKGQEDAITPENIKEWMDQNYANITKKEHMFLAEKTRNNALEQVKRYAEREKGNWSRIKEAELDVSLVEPDYILKGTIDLIRNDSGHVDIVDFKTEEKPDLNSPKDSEYLERYKRQLQIYAHIVEQKYNEPVDNMVLYYTKTPENEAPYIVFPRDKVAIDKTIEQVTDVVHKIEAKDYTMKTRNKKLCEDCDMRAYCKKHWK